MRDMRDMRGRLETRIKKLAYIYKTGWEYVPRSSEAGSVLTDAFLDMAEESYRRYAGMFVRHAEEFGSAAPRFQKAARKLKTGISVRATGEGHGTRIGQGTEVYTIPDGGELLRFVTKEDLRLTAAKLLYGICQRGLCAWLAYEGSGERDAFDISLCPGTGTKLPYPGCVFRFWNLGNGKAALRFFPEFGTKETLPDGEESDWPECWQISDGIHSYPLKLYMGERPELLGDTPDFAENLEDTLYELRPDPAFREEETDPGAGRPGAGFALKEEGASHMPQFCLTEAGVCDGEKVLPFTDAPEAASCCYLACDSALAGRPEEICLKFTLSYETEESVPADASAEMSGKASAKYVRLYKKYPWLKAWETVEEWKVRDVWWEYFDGNLWRPLSGDGGPRACCEPGERVYKWKMPADMRPCVVQGEEHFYLRLRPGRVDNAYAARYRKTIPVLEHVRFETVGRRLTPESFEMPDWEADTAVYLGFDRDVTCEDCWYTGNKTIRFTEEQILGRGARFGREACWVRWEASGGLTLPALYANYVEIAQVSETVGEDAGALRLPAGTAFYVETTQPGVADAISVTDARYDGGGAVIWDERRWREGYPSHYGRLVSAADIGLLLHKSYPSVRLCSCDYAADPGELRLLLDPTECAEREKAQAMLPEICEWLEAALHCMGALWMADCSVRCMLREDIGAREEEEKANGGGEIGG